MDKNQTKFINPKNCKQFFSVLAYKLHAYTVHKYVITKFTFIILHWILCYYYGNDRLLLVAIGVRLYGERMSLSVFSSHKGVPISTNGYLVLLFIMQHTVIRRKIKISILLI